MNLRGTMAFLGVIVTVVVVVAAVRHFRNGGSGGTSTSGSGSSGGATAATCHLEDRTVRKNRCVGSCQLAQEACQATATKSYFWVGTEPSQCGCVVVWSP